MADLRRLGKRGAYRLGQLGSPPSAPRKPPSPHYPSWVPGHRGPVSLWLLGCLAAVAVLAAAAAIGWWFMPFLAGLAGGIASHLGRWRLRTALLATVVVAALGWAVPLGWQAWHVGRGPGHRAGGGRAGRAARAFLGRHRRHPAGRGAPGAGRPVAGPRPVPPAAARGLGPGSLSRSGQALFDPLPVGPIMEG